MSRLVKTRREMRPFGALTPFEEARRVALDICVPINEGSERALRDAVGRVAFADVHAAVDVPSADRAAMDGYALRAADTSGAGPEAPVSLKLAGRVLAGELDEATIAPHHALEVATGALLPRGADAVVPVEMVTTTADEVIIAAEVAASTHVSLRGEDLARGTTIVAAAATVTPGVAGALASAGVASISVRRRPRVLLVPTGDELVPLDQPLRPGQVYDSNSVAVQAVLEFNGAEVERTPIIGDDPQALVDGLQHDGFDLVVTLGGTSVGRHDLVLDVVGGLGEVLVHGIAIKPGKPVLIATVGDTPVLGLPGFPTSCLFTSYLFAEPMVRRLGGLGQGQRRRVQARLAESVVSPVDKLQFLTVRLESDQAVPAYRASSTMTSISAAEGWIEIPRGASELAAGTTVEVTLF